VHEYLRYTARLLRDSVRDLMPAVIVIAAFQFLVIQKPLPPSVDVVELLLGMGAVVAGLALFIQGLELGLFPLGEGLAGAFARKGSVPWLLAFAFALGFGSAIAEPALIAVADKAAHAVAADGLIPATPERLARFALELRMVVALAVGVAVVVGVFRILKDWPLHWMMVGGYVLVIVATFIAPSEIIGIAHDAGGVATSTVTVPLLTALGVGLSRAIRGRNPMTDGFGLIAFASLTPMLFVMAYGIVGLRR